MIENFEHIGIIQRFIKVLADRKETGATTQIAYWIHTSFPEYRHIDIDTLEQEVTKIAYLN